MKEQFEGKYLCTMPGQVLRMENVGGLLIVSCDDGRDYVVTMEGEYRDITGNVHKFREAAV